MIKKEEIQHIADLAKLKLNEKEAKKYQKELAQILDYVSQLQKISLEEKEGDNKILTNKIDNRFREDIPLKVQAELRKKFLKGVPQKKEELIKTRSPLEQ
ncbi:Asp-tRNA(Asn)/Glu-tRNA(Gln) amidotransferase subunit GatC [Patescibacteria group bacterium]|nr:Asp-tRNA(Asn)/Glu-tRNA(Gln) amidotransferase subunit GatC [Patescibacteria group bacterium]